MKKGWLSGISIPLYLLVIVFNLASWIDTNSIWTEMPLLVNRLPEGWELPSNLNLICNAGRVAVIVYVILKKLLKEKIKEYAFVYGIIVIGASCLFVMAFLWDRTAIIFGTEVSLAIMILMFLLSCVDGLSTVVFLPYLSRFSAQYLTAFLVGEGICQLLPAVAGIIQGVGESPDCQNRTVIAYNDTTMMSNTSYNIVAIYPDPKFSVRAFFIMMFCFMVLSVVAFTLIHYLPYFKKKQLGNLDQNDTTIDEMEMKLDAGKLNVTVDEGDSVTPVTHLHKVPNKNNDNTGKYMQNTPKTLTQIGKKDISRGDFVFSLLLLMWGIGIFFGLMPGMQSYSALPYSNMAYNLSIRLGLAVNPIVSFLALFVYTRSKAWISVIFAVGTLATIYQVVLACYSPHPPLKGTAEGEALVILTSVVLIGTFSYGRACLFYILNDGGPFALMWGQAIIHVGTTLGAILSFILISLNVFQAEPPCPGM